jgi:hypothetical protein
MKPVAVRTTETTWEPAFALYGPGVRTDGRELVKVKVLSDRRGQGGGIALLVKFEPPPGKLIKIITAPRSAVHIFVLAGGCCDRHGKQLQFPGDYALIATGYSRSVFIGRETISLVIYSGEPDEVRELSLVQSPISMPANSRLI